VKRAKDGKEEQSSVAKYFTDVYGGLKYPRLPCLVVGSKSRPVYIPLEKCEIYGPQKMGKKINEEQTSILIKAVCTDAITRQDQIMTVCKKANFPADPFLKNFSIRINPNPECVDGRRISAPRIIFFENRMVDPRDGSWSCDRNRFYMPSSFPQYALLSFVRRDKQHIIQNFCDKLCSNASGLGLKNITMPSVVEYINDPAELEDMFKNFKNKHICFIIVVMERKNSLIYSEVKRVGDVVHGIMTQCLQFKTVQNPKPMTVGNILLKVNAKLNGINSLTGASKNIWLKLN
jgi:eukaryotic translation initiation factor 2C